MLATTGPTASVADWLAQYANAVARTPLYSRIDDRPQVPGHRGGLLEDEREDGQGHERHEQLPQLDVERGAMPAMHAHVHQRDGAQDGTR